MLCVCGHKQEEHWKFYNGDRVCIYLKDDFDKDPCMVDDMDNVCTCTNFTSQTTS